MITPVNSNANNVYFGLRIIDNTNGILDKAINKVIPDEYPIANKLMDRLMSIRPEDSVTLTHNTDVLETINAKGPSGCSCVVCIKPDNGEFSFFNILGVLANIAKEPNHRIFKENVAPKISEINSIVAERIKDHPIFKSN